MSDLPVMLHVSGRRCVVVGGGAVAYRRAMTLLAAGAAVTVVAPAVAPEFKELPVRIERRPYARGDLVDAMMVVVATDDPAVNEAVALDARADGVLVNRADDPEAGDLAIPAHSRHGPVTLAVYTNGISAAAAAVIRRQLTEALDPAWPAVLDLVAPFRAIIQDRFADAAERRRRLVALTGPESLSCYTRGGQAALLARCRELTDPRRELADPPVEPAEMPTQGPAPRPLAQGD